MNYPKHLTGKRPVSLPATMGEAAKIAEAYFATAPEWVIGTTVATASGSEVYFARGSEALAFWAAQR